jgi:cholesterol oxidase
MERISSRPELLKQSYEVVIVGSGYGGSILASRLARAGREVCLLERGEEKRPGEYPDSVVSAANDWQIDTPEHHIGFRQGMYQLHVDDDINVFKGCGLGGTSLVNAGVAIEPDERIWDDPRWPAAIRQDREGIGVGFERARHMLGSTPHPEARMPLAKTALLRRSAERMGEQFLLPTINVTFEDGVNAAGVEQVACNGCGDCVSGCNVGAKNTLLMNYLPDAFHWGASIFTGVDVCWLERSGDQWAVRYQVIGAGRSRFGEDPLALAADIVVLAAGALGSTEILLRSQAHGLSTSAKVGSSFTGNGDVLGFAFDCDSDCNGIGWGHEQHAGREPVGPCITGVIDARPGRPLEEGIIIEEGSIPGALAHLIAPAFAIASKERSAGGHHIKHFEQAAAAILEGSYHGPLHRTQTFLVMANDDGAGHMTLEDDRLRLRWPGVGDQPIFRQIDQQLLQASEAVGGSFIPDPMWHALLRHPLITVHPLGGCPMGDTAEAGAVDHMGRVYSSASGSDVHDTLLVCDGSVMPRPLGVNPLLTISALAERTAGEIAAARGWTIDYEGTPPRPAAAVTTALLLEFTEQMSGWVAAGESDPSTGLAKGMEDDTAMWYEISMAGDALASARDASTPAHVTGLVRCAALAPGDITIEDGVFQLIVPQADLPGGGRMLYDLPLRALDGRRFHLHGYKTIRRGEPWQLWHDTTTLFVTVHEDGPDGPVWGAGVLRIAAHDFAKQLTTMRVTGAAPLTQRLEALLAYGRMFAGHLFDYYAGRVGWHHLPPVEQDRP